MKNQAAVFRPLAARPLIGAVTDAETIVKEKKPKKNPARVNAAQ